MGTLGRTTRNGKKPAARRAEQEKRPHPAVAKLAVALREHSEALEQQAATAEILAAISSSTADTKVVFQAIARSALRLCEASMSIVSRYDGELLHLEAHEHVAREGVAFIRDLFPMRPTRGTISGRAALDGRVVHVLDVLADPTYARPVSRALRNRSALAMPIVREGRVVGVIGLGRLEVRRFSAKQIALLKTFADQAAIAIENARLFNETKEALERQTATAEILQVIASSPTDAQPVFNVIVESAVRLCGARFGRVYRYDGSTIHMVASSGLSARGLDTVQRVFPRPAAQDTIVGQVILSRRPRFIHDIQRDKAVPPLSRQMIEALETRSQVTIPMLRGDRPIGAITMGWDEPDGFKDKQVALLQTFATQAVIAIENVRLFNETKAALQQQQASADILRVIAGSPTDVQPVFDAVCSSAARLCDAYDALIWRVEGDLQRVVGHYGQIPTPQDGIPVTRGTTSGRAVIEKRPAQILDLQVAEDEYPEGAAFARELGFRTVLNVPLIRDQVAIGVIQMRRIEARSFTEKELDLVKVFADQAVIAIENVRLFNETKEALEQQTATSEILGVISGSPTDLRPVFDAILKSATQLCEAHLGLLNLYDGEHYRTVAQRGASEEFDKYVFERGPYKPEGGLAKATAERRLVHVPDMRDAPAYLARGPNSVKFVELGGARTYLAVPLVKDGKVIGAILIYRPEVRPFSEKQIALVSMFANQAVIAIENVRLFNELQTRNRALTEALEQQTATGEILKTISSSMSDVQPVFETIIRNAVRLCDGAFGGLFTYDGKMMDIRADYNFSPEARAEFRRVFPQPPSADNPTARAILERTAINMPDALDSTYSDAVKSRARATGYRSGLAVPMMRGDVPIGAITVTRREPGAFGETYVSLLKSFAAQAVIAVENVRLFNEINEALRLQTSTADVLKTISRSTFDLDAVLQALLDNATRLSGAERAMMLRPDAIGNYVPAVTFGFERDSPLLARVRERPIRPGRDSINGRVLLEKRPIHVPDVLADPEYGRQDLVELGSYRTVLSVPMLRDGEAIGLISLNKGPEVDPFTGKQMELVTTFADQAVIAIENVRLFKEIEEKSAQLEVANKHKSDFLANMSHELRTPLNAVIGFSEALMDRMFGELNEKQADYLKDIHESGKHLLSLINDILDLSKIEAGRMELDLSSFHLPTAISNAMTLIRERAQRHGVALGLDVDSRLGEFQADERKVKQIMLNLLSNAVKFTPEGGRVEVSAKLDTDHVEIAVKDTGVGISPDDQTSLFEEFRQVGKDATRKAEGTGLGLALTKRFVELHGGAIRVDSAQGKGSTFTFSLPVRP